MPPSTLPADVQALLAVRIASFEQLELVLLLRAEAAERTAEESSQSLGIDTATAVEALRTLCQHELVALGAAGYRYAPKTPALDHAVANLARCYGEARLEVMRVLSANAVERMRTSTIRMFADAFLIGRGKKDG